MTDLAAGDFDGDNRADLVIAAQGEKGLRLFRGNGDGQFSLRGKLELLFVPDRVVVGNFAGSSLPDIIVVGWSSRRALLYISSAPFAFGSPVALGIPSGARDVWVDQLNDHPGLELVWDTAQRAVVWSFSSTGQVIEWKSVPDSWAVDRLPPRPFLRADLTGDGVREFVYYSQNPGEVFVIGADGQPMELALTPDRLPLARLAVADVDGDGRIDLFGLDRTGKLYLLWRRKS